jgi:hypothetical protein
MGHYGAFTTVDTGFADASKLRGLRKFNLRAAPRRAAGSPFNC